MRDKQSWAERKNSHTRTFWIFPGFEERIHKQVNWQEQLQGVIQAPLSPPYPLLLPSVLVTD